MSEYQYYEFQAIDKPLTEKELAVIDSLSSRVYLTSTQAIFTYAYGDFKGDPSKILEKYYDAMLYLTSWGSKNLIFRFPKELVDVKQLKVYKVEDMIEIRTTKNYVILEISIHHEDGGWIDGEGWLPSILKLRNDLMLGDYRMLYLIWLEVTQNLDDIDENILDANIPIPANLKKLSAPLKSFIELFEIDIDLIKEAVKKSRNLESIAEIDFEKIIPLLSEKEKHEFLIGLLKEEQNLNFKLIKRLKEISKKK